MTPICFVVASPLTAKAFLLPHLRALSSRYSLTLAANFGQGFELGDVDFPLECVHLPISRPIKPLTDLRALLALLDLFQRREFTLVHSFTPKAGLLAMTAARMAGIPHRCHTFTGQVWATRVGVSRAILKAADQWTARFATEVLTDSPSQSDFLREEGILGPGRGSVLGAGSVCGVDLATFRPDPEARQAFRVRLGIPAEATVFMYLGRLAQDKGLLDLGAGFAEVSATVPGAWLVLVGPDEDQLSNRVLEACGHFRNRVRMHGYTDAPEAFLAGADVFCLPSFREGFGTSLLEAAACGVPSVASNIYGLRDAVEDGVTGLLHAPGNIADLSAAMTRLGSDPALREAMGRQARERAARRFAEEDLVRANLTFYERLLGNTWKDSE